MARIQAEADERQRQVEAEKWAKRRLDKRDIKFASANRILIKILGKNKSDQGELGRSTKARDIFFLVSSVIKATVLLDESCGPDIPEESNDSKIASPIQARAHVMVVEELDVEGQ